MILRSNTIVGVLCCKSLYISDIPVWFEVSYSLSWILLHKPMPANLRCCASILNAWPSVFRLACKSAQGSSCSFSLKRADLVAESHIAGWDHELFTAAGPLRPHLLSAHLADNKGSTTRCRDISEPSQARSVHSGEMVGVRCVAGLAGFVLATKRLEMNFLQLGARLRGVIDQHICAVASVPAVSVSRTWKCREGYRLALVLMATRPAFESGSDLQPPPLAQALRPVHQIYITSPVDIHIPSLACTRREPILSPSFLPTCTSPP